MNTLNVKIKGMHCEACASGITLYLGSQEGVSKADVSWKEGKGTFEYDQAKISEEQIMNGIEELGYKPEK